MLQAMTRRELFRRQAAWAVGAGVLPALAASNRADGSTGLGKAKSVIFLYLHGGAPSQDMFDMKPKAPANIRGEFSPIATNVPGIEICEHLPGMARWMHRSAILRAVHHKAGCHNEIPSFSGFESPSGMQELSEYGLPPSMGSVCEYFKPAGQTLPAYVSLPNPLNVVGETGPGPGFLGARYAPLQSRAKPEFDAGAVLNQRPHPPVIRGIPRLEDSLLREGVTPQRLSDRRQLLQRVSEPFPTKAEPLAQFRGFQDLAYEVLTTPQLRDCFDPRHIDERVKERYGNTLFGNSAFIATKLAAAGVKFINVIWTWYYGSYPGVADYGWDTHEHNFSILRSYLPQVDRVYSSLLEDLEQSGRLDETLVVLTTDFGRTPGVNATAGRDHWMHCYSTVLAGAGIRGGTVYGASDAHAAWPVDGPVRPADICATIYQQLGLDPDAVVHDRTGRPHKIAQRGEPI
ncbi:MAG: DUF1501 domain-containing protein, partial [Pirellulales bacterium]